MKRIFSILLSIALFSTAVSARTYTVEQVPNVQIGNRTRYTSNPDNILSESTVAQIDTACDSLRRIGKAEIAVVAIDDCEPDDVFTFAHNLFSEWGVGSSKSDNGLGILLVLKQREIRFVTGEGLEGILPDALCKRIQQNCMVEYFADGDYDRGMIEGVSAIAEVISKGEIYEDESEEDLIALLIIFAVTIGAFSLLFAVLMYIDWQKKRCPHCKKYTLKLTDSHIISDKAAYREFEKTFVCQNCGHKVHRKSKEYKEAYIAGTGGGRGIGHGGGGFGGGSFGGGHFGGGGAGSRF